MLGITHMAYKIKFKSNNENDAIHLFYAFFWASFPEWERI